MGDSGGGRKIERLEVPWEEPLVDDADDGIVEPDSAVGGALDIHVEGGGRKEN